MLSRPQGTSRRTCRKDGVLLAPLDGHRLDLGGAGRIAPALFEQAFAGHHLGEDQAERVQVRPPIDAADQVRGAVQEGGEVLGGRVGHRPAEDGVGLCPAVISWATLKSSRSGCPSALSRMFDGLISRWRMPR